MSLGLVLAPALAACATTSSLDNVLRLEDRPEDAVLRVHNRSARDATVWYNYSEYFADGPQMLHVRWRDRDNRIVHFNGTWPGLGWWTPLTLISSVCPREGCPRQSFTVPPRGHVDLERNLAWFTSPIRGDVSSASPCQIQFVLFAYERRRSDRATRIASEWQPADCPRRSQ